MTEPQLTRQGFLGEKSHKVLRETSVGIVGLGGGGSHVVQQLAHLGVGKFFLFDHDQIEESNLNRLIGGNRNDVLKSVPKVEIAGRLIRGINPRATVAEMKCKWQEAAPQLRLCDMVFGCVDSFTGRDELERALRRYLTPYIDIGMDVHEESNNTYSITGQVALSMPGEACLHCMNVLRPELIALEAQQYGQAGARPQVVWSNGILASLAVGLFVQLVTPWHQAHEPVVLLEYNGNSSEVHLASALSFLREKECPHFPNVVDLGDPWYSL